VIRLELSYHQRMRRVGILWSAILASAVAFSFACGGSDNTTADAGPTPTVVEAEVARGPEMLPACSLVTRQQAEEVLGFDVNEPRLTEDGMTCVYEETDPNDLGGTVLVSQTDGFGLFDSFGGEYEPITALGDEARYYGDVLALVVRRGDRFISIELRTSNRAPEDLTVARGFAQHALEALP